MAHSVLQASPDICLSRLTLCSVLSRSLQPRALHNSTAPLTAPQPCKAAAHLHNTQDRQHAQGRALKFAQWATLYVEHLLAASTHHPRTPAPRPAVCGALGPQHHWPRGGEVMLGVRMQMGFTFQAADDIFPPRSKQLLFIEHMNEGSREGALPVGLPFNPTFLQGEREEKEC